MKYDKMTPPTGGEGGFMKLALGANKVRLVTEPEERGTHFVQSEKKGYTCIGKDEGCSFCLGGEKPNVRFLYRVIDRKDGQVKLLEVGWSIVSQIKDLHDSEEYAFEDVPPYDVTITKSGAGLDTEYSVMAARTNTALTDAETEELAKQKPLAEVLEAIKNKNGAPAAPTANGVPTVVGRNDSDDIEVESIPF